jgi:hypothetical protein
LDLSPFSIVLSPLISLRAIGAVEEVFGVWLIAGARLPFLVLED